MKQLLFILTIFISFAGFSQSQMTKISMATHYVHFGVTKFSGKKQVSSTLIEIVDDHQRVIATKKTNKTWTITNRDAAIYFVRQDIVQKPGEPFDSKLKAAYRELTSCSTRMPYPYKIVYNAENKAYAVQAGTCINPIQNKYVNQKAGEPLLLGWAHRKDLAYPGGEDSTIALSTPAEGFYTTVGFYSFQELTFPDSCLAKMAVAQYQINKKFGVTKSKKAEKYGCYRCDPRDIQSYKKKHTYKKP